MGIQRFGDLGLDAVFVGLEGIFDGSIVRQGQYGFNGGRHIFIGGLVALMGHDLLHAARDVAAGQITVHHVAVARGHIVHGVNSNDLVPAPLPGVGFVVDDGCVQIHLHAVGNPLAPLMGVLLDVEAVFAVFQHIAALAEVIKGSQVVCREGNGYFF